MNTQKGKEVASKAHLKLENKLKLVKSSLCAELEKNKQLQEKLGRLKSDIEKSLKWTWSSDSIAALYTNNGGNRQGIGFQRKKTPYNPHSKYVTIPDNWLCTHCGNTGHFKENCKAKIQSQHKNKVFAKNITAATEPGPSHKKHIMPGTMKESSQQWYIDSGFSNHITGSTNDFLLLKALQGGCVSLENGKKGYILGVGRIEKSLSHSIDNVYYMKGLKLGHASFTLLNKLVKKDPVRGLPKTRFKDHRVCDACVKGKQDRSSFKPKKEVSISGRLDLLHMDLCGSMRVPSS
ncbi:uncharacterized protein [Nicotiana sylvestris]|uniref:uncharacterized protein n=1 Tax=Nicotiana sylvestris TaxID=4096 RepID=UPI00388CCBC8